MAKRRSKRTVDAAQVARWVADGLIGRYGLPTVAKMAPVILAHIEDIAARQRAAHPEEWGGDATSAAQPAQPDPEK